MGRWEMACGGEPGVGQAKRKAGEERGEKDREVRTGNAGQSVWGWNVSQEAFSAL